MNEKTYCLKALKATLPLPHRPMTKLALDEYVRDPTATIRTASEKAVL